MLPYNKLDCLFHLARIFFFTEPIVLHIYCWTTKSNPAQTEYKKLLKAIHSLDGWCLTTTVISITIYISFHKLKPPPSLYLAYVCIWAVRILFLGWGSHEFQTFGDCSEFGKNDLLCWRGFVSCISKLCRWCQISQVFHSFSATKDESTQNCIFIKMFLCYYWVEGIEMRQLGCKVCRLLFSKR